MKDIDKKYRIKWINGLKHAIIQESLHTGIYPSVTLAIAILESGYGTSFLARKHYNFFGMCINPLSIGKTVTFWDGTCYIGEGNEYEFLYADYAQAGDYAEGFLLSLRHFGWNFWATWQYRRAGVLNHISSGLTVSEAKKDAIKQLAELSHIYYPHPDLEGDLIYTLTLIELIDQYDLWKYDREFLKFGGWDGTVPYSFNRKKSPCDTDDLTIPE